MCAITKQEDSTFDEVQAAARSKAILGPPPSPAPALNEDVLAYVTKKHKILVDYLNDSLEKVKTSQVCRVASRTTQPAHVMAALAALYVGSVFLPKEGQRGHSPTMNLLFLASVSIHIGAQFWMTFISGLALYFALPRHVFGDVQKVLFPKYFALNAFLSGVTMLAFGKIHQGLRWETRHWIQASSIGTCFMVELLIRLYAVPVVLQLITAKTELEKRVPGVGEEVGCHAPGRLARCPHYTKLHSAFRRHHLVVALGNITAMACTTLQLHYIQQNWSCLL